MKHSGLQKGYRTVQSHAELFAAYSYNKIVTGYETENQNSAAQGGYPL